MLQSVLKVLVDYPVYILLGLSLAFIGLSALYFLQRDEDIQHEPSQLEKHRDGQQKQIKQYKEMFNIDVKAEDLDKQELIKQRIKEAERKEDIKDNQNKLIK